MFIFLRKKPPSLLSAAVENKKIIFFQFLKKIFRLQEIITHHCNWWIKIYTLRLMKSILEISTNYCLFVSKMGISLHELLCGKIKPGTWPFKYFPNPISEVTATPEGEMTPHITPTPQTFWTFQFHFSKSKITWAVQGPEKVKQLM